MNYRRFRLYSFIKRNFWILSLILIAIAIASGFTLYKLSKPEYKTVKVNVPFYTVEGGYDGYAVVMEENPIWDVGEILRDKPIYISSVAPELNVSFSFKINGKDVNVTICESSRVVYFSEYDDKVVWELEYLNSSKISNGDSISDTISINISELRNKIIETQKSLGFRDGKTGVKVVTDVKYSGYVDDKPVEGRKVYTLPIVIGSNTYKFNNFIKSENIERFEDRTVVIQPLLTYKVVSAIAMIVSLTLFGVFAFIRFTFKPENYDIDKLKLESEEKKFEKWISHGTLKSVESTARIELDSLEDLFNTAIDTNERIIYDSDRKGYFLIHNNVLYTYKPKTERSK